MQLFIYHYSYIVIPPTGITIFVSVSWCYFFNRVVEKEKDVYKDVNVPLTLFFNKVLLVKYTGISFADSTLQHQCKNKKRIHKVVKGITRRGKPFAIFFFCFKLHSIYNEKGEHIRILICSP